MTKNKKFKRITINLTDEEFLFIAKKAHALDITFNQMACKILEDQLKKFEKEYGKIQSRSSKNLPRTSCVRGRSKLRKTSARQSS